MATQELTPLQKALNEKDREVFGNLESGEQSYYKAFEADLMESDVKHHHLREGDRMPEFSLPDHQGKLRHSSEFLDRQWLVLTFYRGAWCPYCNLQLKALQRYLHTIEDTPASLVAISPQKPDQSLNSMKQNQLTFPVLSDVGNHVGRKFKIVYKIPPYLNHIYQKLGVDVEAYNGEGELYLPMAATFVIGEDGIIQMASVSAHAHQRPDPKEVVRFIVQAS